MSFTHWLILNTLGRLLQSLGLTSLILSLFYIFWGMMTSGGTIEHRLWAVTLLGCITLLCVSGSVGFMYVGYLITCKNLRKYPLRIVGEPSSVSSYTIADIALFLPTVFFTGVWANDQFAFLPGSTYEPWHHSPILDYSWISMVCLIAYWLVALVTWQRRI